MAYPDPAGTLALKVRESEIERAKSCINQLSSDCSNEKVFYSSNSKEILRALPYDAVKSINQGRELQLYINSKGYVAYY